MRIEVHISRVLSALLFVAAAGVLAPTAPARAGIWEDTIAPGLRRDMAIVSANTPVFLANQMPSMLAPMGFGAGLELQDADWGKFSVGVIARVGVFSDFAKVGGGSEIIDFESALPSVLPWPNIGLTANLNVGNNIEIGLDLYYIPTIDVSSTFMALQMHSFALSPVVRYRFNEASRYVPAVVVGLGGSYYAGNLELGLGYQNDFDIQADDGRRAKGHLIVGSGPSFDWNVWHVQVDGRTVWDLGFFRPYAGIGVGVTKGTVSNDLRMVLDAKYTITDANGDVVNEDAREHREDLNILKASAATFALRPVVGADFVFGYFAITLQLDMAWMASPNVNATFGEDLDRLSSDTQAQLEEAVKATGTANFAMVFDLALRVQL